MIIGPYKWAVQGALAQQEKEKIGCNLLPAVVYPKKIYNNNKLNIFFNPNILKLILA